MNRRGFMKAFAALGLSAPAATAVAEELTAEVLIDKFEGDGWYTHEERTGVMGVYHIEERWSDMDREWIYVAKSWPAQHTYADHVFSRDEVSAFIHGPAEWAQDAADLVWADGWRVRREA